MITVLLACAVLLVVCLGLATMSILDLNVAGNYSTATQSLLMAEAAVSQVQAELNQAQQEDTGNASDLTGQKHFDLLARFQHPVFPSGAEHFPGDVSITFDTGQDHYSVDNSYNADPAAGWLDNGTARKSIRPFSIDLIIGVQLGGHHTWYEALLRRRWPYVLCTAGRVTMMGAPTYNLDHQTGTVVPSTVHGNIYLLPDVEFTPPQPDGEAAPPDSQSNIFVDANLIYNLLGVIPQDPAVVNVGGTANVTEVLGSGLIPLTAPIPIVSRGNSLLGSVDLESDDPRLKVSVYPGNTAQGSLRRDVKPYDIVKNLQQAFQVAPVDDYHEVPLQANPPGWTPSPPPMPPAANDTAPSGEPSGSPSGSPAPGAGGGPGGGSSGAPDLSPAPSSSSSPAPSSSGSPSPAASGSPAPEPAKAPFYVLFHDLVLEGPPGDAFQYDPSARYKIGTPAGNRYVVNGNEHNVYYTGAGIELHNCILYIHGNLDLSSTRPLPGHKAIVPALRGSNATVIVDGTLLVNNGSLSASEQGMVIFCRRLVSAAQGYYRGLIMVQKSAAICPAYPGASITIQGGVVCGGDPVALYTLNPNFDPSAATEPEHVSVFLQGLHLWSTKLTYDPRFLKTLNRFGPLVLLSLKPIQ